jgi:hypothetical protein
METLQPTGQNLDEFSTLEVAACVPRRNIALKQNCLA